MDSNRFRRVEEIYNGVLEQPRESRAGFLAAACGPDSDLRREVESLLAHFERTNGVLGKAGWAAGAEMMSAVSPALSPGMKLGPFEISGMLGRGGMGEVYEARDIQLKRTVAIKVLPSSISHRPDLKLRFKREAQAVAGLNHPHICTLHAVGDHDGIDYIVMEYVDGETLAERIARGRLPLAEALDISRQMAEALEEAHTKGVVHRDLKPGNIKITRDGKVKVLDFGLAKIFASGDPADGLTANAGASTEGHLILGTVSYMSPEQARGKAIDKRTDIWAWGCVLYEMLTGSRTFTGATTTDVIARIASEEPDWTRLPDNTPESIRTLLHRVLEKDPNRRLHDIADARIEIEAPRPETFPVGSQPQSRNARWHYVLTMLFALVAVAFGAAYFRRAPLTQPMVQFDDNAPGASSSFALSQDGRFLTYVGSAEGKRMLLLRSLDSVVARPVPGSEGAADPFWSPDGTSIGFFTRGKLKTVNVSNGSIQTVTTFDPARDVAGGTWNRDGVILFAFAGSYPIFRVLASGGQAVPFTKPAEGEGHRFPLFLPDGQHFLYFNANAKERFGIHVGADDGTDLMQLNSVDSRPGYASTGFLFFVTQEQLMAQRFDAASLTISGPPVSIAQDMDPVAQPGGHHAFAVALNGTIVYRTNVRNAVSRLSWFDRTGREMEVVGPEDLNAENPELSPDGKTIAVSRLFGGGSNTWTLETLRSGLTKITSAFSHGAIWSPESRWLAVWTRQKEIRRKPANGGGSDEIMVKEPDAGRPEDWSADGRFLLYEHHVGISTNSDLWYLPLSEKSTGRLYLGNGFNERLGQFSPDVRWVAYQSDESGTWEIYIQSFPEPGRKFPVSAGGGMQPRWRRDGKELFYIASDQKMMSVSIRSSPDGRSMEIGNPQPLFQTHILDGFANPQFRKHQYAVAADGQRFLVNSSAETTKLTVVLNWAGTSDKR